MIDIALVQGPYLRPSGMRKWEYLHNNYDYDVVAFSSEPERFPTHDLQMPVESLQWIDGKLDLFGHDYILSKILRRFNLPSNYLLGLKDIADRFDIIHSVENYHIFSFLSAYFAKKKQKKFCFSAGQNIPYPITQRSLLTWNLKKYVNSRTDGVDATTKLGKRAHIHEGVDHDNVQVVPNSVSIDVFSPTVPDYDKLPIGNTDRFRITFVHKLCEQKGTPHLLDSFAEINGSDLELILVGENKLDQKYTEYINNTSNITHISWLDRVNMPDLYLASDVVVLPSVTMTHNEEQFGMAVIEAMACGIPTIVSDVGGLPHVVDEGSTSLVIDERDSDAISRSILELKNSDQLYNVLSKGSRERAVSNFSRKHVANELDRYYKEVVL
jgi:glycosyltransferase involved in cell wall biosynthesis